MEYSTTKTVTDWEFETLYNSDDVNIDTELQWQFREDNPTYEVTGSIGHIESNGDGTKTYYITFTYEIN
jgi:hypothetical protein